MAESAATIESDPQGANGNNHVGTPTDHRNGFLSTSLFEHGNDMKSVKLSPEAMENDDHMHLDDNAKWIESVSGKQYSTSQRH